MTKGGMKEGRIGVGERGVMKGGMKEERIGEMGE